MNEILINGKELEKYLAKYNVSKFEFLQAMNRGKPYLSQEEDGYDYVDGQDDNLGLELFDEVASLNAESAKRFLNFIGRDDAENIINWRSMGIEQADYSRIFQILGMFRIRLANANNRCAI